MAVQYAKIQNWPELSDAAIERIEAVLADKLEAKWVTSEELSAYQDLLFDHIIATRQTHPGEIILQ